MIYGGVDMGLVAGGIRVHMRRRGERETDRKDASPHERRRGGREGDRGISRACNSVSAYHEHCWIAPLQLNIGNMAASTEEIVKIGKL
jgi:hypothetical protein